MDLADRFGFYIHYPSTLLGIELLLHVGIQKDSLVDVDLLFTSLFDRIFFDP